MGSVAFQFGSYQFTGTNALISSLDIRSDNRLKAQNIPSKDGASIDEAKLNPLVVSFKGTLSGDTQAGLRTLKDDFLNAICDGTQHLHVWDDRYVVAQKRSLSYDYRASLGFMPFSVSFVAGTPFWLASTASQDVESATVVGGTYNYNINTTGSAYAKPTITITAIPALSSIVLENTTTNEAISFSGTVLSSAALVINCDTGAVTNSGVDEIENFTGEFMKVINGTNALEYTGGNCTITIDWTERYY